MQTKQTQNCFSKFNLVLPHRV